MAATTLRAESLPHAAPCLEHLEQDTPEDFRYRDPSWNPWLYAKGERLQRAIADVIRQALNAEQLLPKFRRQRARRPADLTAWQARVEALLVHAAYEYLRGAGPVRVALRDKLLNRSSRYRSPLQTTQIREALYLLSTPELSFLAVEKGTKATAFSPGRQTTFSAGPRLISRLEGVTLDDIGRRPGEELVLLKGLKDDHTGTAELIEYKDTEWTTQHRTELREINTFMAGADIQYVGDTELVDDRDRFMRRYFTRGDWCSGGRLFGGFWQKLKKQDRLANVLINSEPVVGLDFEGMVLAIAYAHSKLPAPEGDLYRITFTSTDGLPRLLPRSTVKKIVASILNGAREWPAELREHRSGLPWRSVVDTVKRAHPRIAEWFDRNAGQLFMFEESEVLVEALLNLKDSGVVALPVHDCIVVAESDCKVARAALLASFEFHLKQPARVTIERAKETD